MPEDLKNLEGFPTEQITVGDQNLEVLFVEPTHCHSKPCESRTNLNVLPNNRVTKMFRACPHDLKQFL